MASRHWLGGAEKIGFTNGEIEPNPGDIFTGKDSKETCVVLYAEKTSGTWGVDAAGNLFVKEVSGAFQAEQVGVGAIDYMDIAGDFVAEENDVNSKGNWSDFVVPASWGADDKIYLDSRANLDSDGLQFALDWTNGGAQVPIALLHVKSTFLANIGTADIPMQTYLPTGKVIFEGLGNCYLQCANNSSNGDIAFVYNNSVSGHLYLSSEDNAGGSTNLFHEIFAGQGALDIADDTAFAWIEVIHPSAVVTIGTGCVTVQASYWSGIALKASHYDNNVANEVPKYVMHAGILTTDSPLVTDITTNPERAIVEVFGGTFNWGTDGNITETGMDAGLIRVYNGGVFNWRVHEDATSILWAFEVYYGGQFLATSDVGSGGLKQIGNTGGDDSFIWPGSIVNLDCPSGSNIDMHADVELVNYGGSLTLPSGQGINW